VLLINVRALFVPSAGRKRIIMYSICHILIQGAAKAIRLRCIIDNVPELFFYKNGNENQEGLIFYRAGIIEQYVSPATIVFDPFFMPVHYCAGYCRHFFSFR
jgi:hypothetical protein